MMVMDLVSRRRKKVAGKAVKKRRGGKVVMAVER